jgi:RHS repeat-associated protein
VEYIAFGEVLFEEHSSSFSSPYLFNGKELDRETNLSYYGARYYDAKSSLWLNVDPLATYNPIFEDEFYFDGDHNGGIYNPRNLNVYGYCYQNPIKLVDPNGKQVNSSLLLKANFKTIYTRSGKPISHQYGYKFTEGTAHLLSKVSKVNKKDITNTQVDFSKYGDAGASITLGSSPQNATITHFYSNDEVNYPTNGAAFYSFFKRNAHEVGHIPQLKYGNLVHIVTSLLEYGANIVDGQDWHDGHNSTKEPEADVGEYSFVNFNKFINDNYGSNKLKELFENKNNTQKDITNRIDQWWSAYQENKFNNSEK